MKLTIFISQARPYHANGQARSLGKADPGLRQDIDGTLTTRPSNPPTRSGDQSIPESLPVRVPLQASRPIGQFLKRLVHLRPAVQVSNVPDPTQPRNLAKPDHSAKAGPGLTQNTENLGTSHQISVCPSGSLSKPPIQRVICIRRSVHISNLPSHIPGPTLPRNRDKLDHSTRADSGLAQRS